MLQTVEAPEITSPEEDGFASRLMLTRLARNWESRAQVRRANKVRSADEFDPKAPDFLIELLPFKDHPRFESFSPDEVQSILSAAWLIYNAKTLDIETRIVNPLCNDVLIDRIPGLNDVASKQVVSETMVDESYHVLLTYKAVSITKKHRGLNIAIAPSALLRYMGVEQQKWTQEWQRTLVQFATGLVSEVFISDYLLALSSATKIQPLHRETVDAHRKDEAAHREIFRHLAMLVYGALSTKEKEFFASVLAKPVRWFAAQDYSAWAMVFEQLGMRNVTDMLIDCERANDRSIDNIDYSGVLELAEELGINDLSVGRDAFAAEGLIR
ncbi:MAG: hypothetical protein Tsb0020_08320 [Haliangiales bacterium]